mmetsp:Transcript_26891/g.86864  ORF Transcript_26891/g.86864 Transcript_26891/m.86864 type:complete len:231 (+) Transcript_26891:158-850(+)
MLHVAARHPLRRVHQGAQLQCTGGQRHPQECRGSAAVLVGSRALARREVRRAVPTRTCTSRRSGRRLGGQCQCDGRATRRQGWQDSRRVPHAHQAARRAQSPGGHLTRPGLRDQARERREKLSSTVVERLLVWTAVSFGNVHVDGIYCKYIAQQLDQLLPPLSKTKTAHPAQRFWVDIIRNKFLNARKTIRGVRTESENAARAQRAATARAKPSFSLVRLRFALTGPSRV